MERGPAEFDGSSDDPSSGCATNVEVADDTRRFAMRLHRSILRIAPGRIREPAPEFGQHTELILTELLGYSWDRVGELREKQVI